MVGSISSKRALRRLHLFNEFESILFVGETGGTFIPASDAAHSVPNSHDPPHTDVSHVIMQLE